ncbi:MAG: alpha/beta fold hydrolase [bacterium]
MRHLQEFTILLALIAPFTCAAQQPVLPAATATQQTIAGNWAGVLSVSGMNLRLVLKVKQTPTGELSAKLDSIDQAANDLPIDMITFKDGSLVFEAKKLNLSFSGTLGDESSEIVGTLRQGEGSFPLTFKRTEKPPTLSRPQDPQKPYPYAEEEVSYNNTNDKVKLTGTLTLPPSKTPVPAVVLITGSGPQDRNETILGHRPFLVIADYLTRHGIAVLRVDDRGMGGSTLGVRNATSANYAEDVLAGVAFLKARKEIDPHKIGLIGHSEGGMIAPMVAAKSKDVAFIVLLAGPGQTGRDVILLQGDLGQKAGGTDPETIVRVHKVYEQIFDTLKGEKDSAAAEKKIRAAVAAENGTLMDAQKKSFASVVQLIDTQMPMYLSDWFRYFLLFDPAPTLAQVRVPVLALNGEKDLQVPPKENLALIEAALKRGGNKHYTVMLMPGLNHLFQHAQTGLPSEYGASEETIAPVVLQTISDWILKQTIHP